MLGHLDGGDEWCWLCQERLPPCEISTHSRASPSPSSSPHVRCLGIFILCLQGRREELFVVTKIWNDEHRPAVARCVGLSKGV